ncbi:restriction endonuclease subunit S [Methanosarcina acetivorans]|uniref:restriction endonuclease subunit S n=1 Tax=Methanosarcina acetivorans TaxID=2214 RepID=UPI000B23A34A|nr:restriction endonuclease subunit S [Methanosarcina acetivorans]
MKILKDIEDRTAFVTVKHLSAKQLNTIKIPVPPLETQQKIVSILKKAEETKKLRAQADELTQKLLQSVFLEMFGDPVVNPKNWKEIKLKDVSEIVSGVTKGRKLAGKPTVFVPYLRVANVQDGYLDLTEIKEIEVLPSDVEKYALQGGDILLTEGGDPDKLGRGAVWNRQIPTCIHQNHIFRVRVNRECLVPEYLSMLIGSTYGKMYFLKSAKQTTGIASINSTQLKNFPALIASLDLQLRFAEMVHQIEKTTVSQQQSSFKINNLFDSLMQKAFTGELFS